MIHQSTIELLKEMRFSGMAAELEKQLNNAEAYREMPFEDRLSGSEYMYVITTSSPKTSSSFFIHLSLISNTYKGVPSS